MKTVNNCSLAKIVFLVRERGFCCSDVICTGDMMSGKSDNVTSFQRRYCNFVKGVRGKTIFSRHGKLNWRLTVFKNNYFGRPKIMKTNICFFNYWVFLFILQQGHNFQCHRSTPSHKYRYFVRAFLWVDTQPPGAYHDSAFLELKVLDLNSDDNFCAHSNFLFNWCSSYKPPENCGTFKLLLRKIKNV